MNRVTRAEREALIDGAVIMFKQHFEARSRYGKEFVAAFQKKHPEISLARIRGCCATAMRRGRHPEHRYTIDD